MYQSELDENIIIEVIQSMNEDHSFYIKDGIRYNRIFTIPNSSIDVKYDPYSAADFNKVTGGNKKGTIGDLFDRSREFSEKRAGNSGQDSIKEQFYKDYAKERNGKEHPDVKKRKLKEKLKNNPLFTVD